MDSILCYGGSNPIVPGDTNNTKGSYVKRGADGSVNVGTCNTTALVATAAYFAGLALSATASLTTLATKVVANATSAAFTITLPAAAASTGQAISIIKIDNAHTVTLQGAGSENINGANTYALSTQYQVARLWCDGTQWWVF